MMLKRIFRILALALIVVECVCAVALGLTLSGCTTPHLQIRVVDFNPDQTTATLATIDVIGGDQWIKDHDVGLATRTTTVLYKTDSTQFYSTARFGLGAGFTYLTLAKLFAPTATSSVTKASTSAGGATATSTVAKSTSTAKGLTGSSLWPLGLVGGTAYLGGKALTPKPVPTPTTAQSMLLRNKP